MEQSLPADTLELFQRMVDRDNATRDQLGHTASRLGDLASAMSSMQGELGRLVSLAERQEEFNRQQLVLAERSATHATTFDRAFTDIEDVRRDFTAAVQELTQQIGAATRTVIEHQSGVATIRWVVITFMPILLILIGFVYQVGQERIEDTRNDATVALVRLERRVDELNAADDRELAEIKVALRDLKTAEGLR